MQEIAAREFPFVEAMPKREKSRTLKKWDVLMEFIGQVKQHGALIPTAAAADVLGVSRQRVDDVIRDGRLVAIKFGNHLYITEASLMQFAGTERKAGRPCKVPTFDAVDCVAVARGMAGSFHKDVAEK